MLLSYSLHLPITSSYSHTSNRSPNSSGYIKFRTRYRENLRYLRALTIIDPKTKPEDLPLPNDVDHIIDTLTFLKSHSFSDADIPRLKFLTPELFTTAVVPSDVSAVFRFLADDLAATKSESRDLILRCPKLLFSHVDLCLRPTLQFLRQVGVQGLNRPTTRNAHLLNTRVDKLHAKVEFLQELGFSYEEAVRACARLPAIFGYDVENNLWPKFVYLVKEMERDLEDLKRFPQYFGFSLKERIVPRHLHLKKRGVRIPLNRMLMWADPKFYAKWK
ncbi:transcription termination factor MTEF1, chloroplastic isoform X1 [Glycine soja]|uniref:Transcription termination factor MTEF1, chloroplastic isoform A n=1 Tax=Glycine soja TaxID=3848 RepID=A0A445FWN9_GLYSO|nr:transcription termination factor MTEF1, chloroplastic isoform X1 [Glycine soja]RZB53204.1 Transcription termination factor MTEF1, chloroplastic isoform A [Glycine soja]